MLVWNLVMDDGTPVLFGQAYSTFRKELLTITGGTPPHNPSSTGRVYGKGFEYYPSVFGMKWIKEI